MQLKDIKITGINVIATVNGAEELSISVAYMKGKSEMFATKTVEVSDTVTLAHLQNIIDEFKELTGIKNG